MNFSKGRRTLYVYFVTSNDCVSKKINNREIQAHFALHEELLTISIMDFISYI